MAQRIDCRSPLGPLLDELRRDTPRSGVPAVARPRPSGRAEPELTIETRVVSAPVALRGVDGRERWLASIAAHALALAALLGLPLLRSEELPPPTAATRAFFVQPAMAPPLPPPPAPRAMGAPQARTKQPPPDAQALVAPIRIPDVVKAEDVAEEVDSAGEAGGVEGGVPGGVVGGVIGGLPESPPPPPPSRVRAGIEVKEPTKVKHVEPIYPDVAVRASIQGIVILELTIMPAGRVADVRVLRSVPLLDAAAIEAARQWVYTPTLLDGVPVSVVMTVTVRFNLTQQGGAAPRPLGPPLSRRR